MADAYCNNVQCEYQESCGCEYEGSITIDEDGFCSTFRYKSTETDEKGGAE